VIGLCATGQVHATLVLLPAVWFLHVLALTGVVWFLSLLSVVLRDLQMVLALVTMTLMIASPIAYAPDNVPHGVRFLLHFNPFAWYVIVYQKVLIFGAWPSLLDWAALLACSALFFGLGGYFFACMKKAITDHV
jgi:lipopolysaccharide transport system permease protein